jgi:hypothetical protein
VPSRHLEWEGCFNPRTTGEAVITATLAERDVAARLHDAGVTHADVAALRERLLGD